MRLCSIKQQLPIVGAQFLAAKVLRVLHVSSDPYSCLKMPYKPLPLQSSNTCNNNLNRLLVFAACVSVLVSFAAISVAIHCHIRLHQTQLTVDYLESVLDGNSFDYDVEDPNIRLSNEDYTKENAQRIIGRDNSVLTNTVVFSPFLQTRTRRNVAPIDVSEDVIIRKSEESVIEGLERNNINVARSMEKRDIQQNEDTTYQTPNKKIYRKSIDTDGNVNSELIPTNANPREKSLCRHNVKQHRQNSRLEFMDEDASAKCHKMKVPVAAHYDGYTGHYVPGIHKQYKGNGRLQHLKDRYMDWKHADWMERLGMDKYFSMIEGVLTIAEQGLYLIYAQIHYVDVQDTQAFRIYKNDMEIIQCTTMTHTNHSVTKSNSCYTSALEYLMVNDRLMIVDVTRGVHSIFQEGKSFFGMVKLGDGKYK